MSTRPEKVEGTKGFARRVLRAAGLFAVMVINLAVLFAVSGDLIGRPCLNVLIWNGNFRYDGDRRLLVAREVNVGVAAGAFWVGSTAKVGVELPQWLALRTKRAIVVSPTSGQIGDLSPYLQMTVAWRQNDKKRFWLARATGFYYTAFDPLPLDTASSASFHLAIPLWAAFAFAVCLDVLVAYPMVRRRSRVRYGKCVDCGYDLRGLKGRRCPECGKNSRLQVPEQLV